MIYRIIFTRRFQKDYRHLPPDIRDKADEQLRRLANAEFSHPSLRAKKMTGEEKIWEASVTMQYRIVFELEGDLLTFLKIGPHDIL